MSNKSLDGQTQPQDPDRQPDHRAVVNRANAKHSTGPRTDAGKQRSSMNALRHGLTARAILLPNEDPAAYQRHTQGFFDQYQPKNANEQQLVQALADIGWRLNRIVTLEGALFSLGDPAQEDNTRTFDTQIRGLNSFSMHGHRLSRDYEKTLQQLRAIQKERSETEQHQLAKAADLLEMDEKEEIFFDPEDDGFVFSALRRNLTGAAQACLSGKEPFR